MGKIYTIRVVTRSYEAWINFIGENRIVHQAGQSIDTLVVDFSYATFLQPFHLVSLACLIEEYHQAGIKVHFVEGGMALNNYLNNIKFYKYWSEGFNRNRFTHAHISTTFCLWKVNSDMIDNYANEAKNYFERNFFSGKNLESLSIPLKEIFNNIDDHAASPVSGYVLTQYYPNLGEIRTAICDFGVGIPDKINTMWEAGGKARLSDEDALRAAFKRKVSSKSTPRNRGLGLYYLLSNVKYLKGDLTLYSNNAFLEHKDSNGLRIYQPNYFFQGTLINISLKTEFLPQAEDEIEDEEFLL
ncbi:hypothetical protein OB13_10795 [Pontibacter sp. HJ8]